MELVIANAKARRAYSASEENESGKRDNVPVDFSGAVARLSVKQLTVKTAAPHLFSACARPNASWWCGQA